MDSLFEVNGKEEYQLIEAEPPERTRHEFPIYDQILNDFRESGLRCVKVVKGGCQMSTVSNELRKSRKRLAPDFDHIQVLFRKDEDSVYLLNKTSK
jgi:hypothetical protein